MPGVGEIILLVVLVVMLIAMFVLSYMRKKKYNQGLNTMREELKIGDKVMTDSGIVGEIVDSYTEEEYKYYVLKSGFKDKFGYYSVHANAVYYVFGKEENKKVEPEIRFVEEEKKEEPKNEATTEEKPKQQNNKSKSRKSKKK